MISETSLTAQQCRLREWAEQIRDCQNRAEGISIIEWCSRNGITSITKANYYYRLRRVRRHALTSFQRKQQSGRLYLYRQDFCPFRKITVLLHLHADWSCPSTGSAFI